MSELPIMKMLWSEYASIDNILRHGKYITNVGIYFWENGIRHRVDGPAIEYTNGDKHWYFHGKQFSSQEAMEQSAEYYIFENGLEHYE